MIHTVILIRPVKVAGKPGETWYRMAVVSKADMPAVGCVSCCFFCGCVNCVVLSGDSLQA